MRSRLLLIFVWALVMAAPAYATEAHVRLVVPSELKASGVFDSLLPVYREARGGEVDLIASDDPIGSARRGEADLIVSTLGREKELALVEEGWFEARYDLMGRMFVISGPASDPAGIAKTRTAIEAVRMIHQKSASFVSLSDQPISRALELALWDKAGLDVKKDAKWYRTDTLGSAMKGRAYAIAERAQVNGGAAVLYEHDPMLIYQYSLLPVSKRKLSGTRYRESMNLVRWLMSDQAQKGIDAFMDSRGISPFKSNAKPCHCE